MTRWKWALIMLVLLPVSALLGLLLWWWLCQQQTHEAVIPVKVRQSTPTGTSQAPMHAARPAPATADDLKHIAGIGPKISSLLQTAGITTFAELAATDVSRLERILKEYGIRLADPGTWPQQASLAAAGEWEALKALQGELKGGRSG